jgi:hypothetical protein
MIDKKTIGRNILLFITSWVVMGLTLGRLLQGRSLATYWWMGVICLAGMLIRLSIRGVRQ